MRWLLWPLFPRGFAFDGGRSLKYDARRGRVAEVDVAGGEHGDFVVTVPALTLKEALAQRPVSRSRHHHVRARPAPRRIDPRKVYGLFVLFQFDDYGHLASPRAAARWLWAGIKRTVALRLPLPG